MKNSELCSYFSNKHCLICNKIEHDYTIQLNAKMHSAIENLGIPFDHFIPIQPSPPLGFRDKMKLQVSGTFENPTLGFLDPLELEVLYAIEACPLHSHELNALIVKIKDVIIQARLVPYDVKKRTGELKGIIAFFSPSTKQSYIRFILRSKESIDRIRNKVYLLADVNVVTANIQPIPHALIEGDEEIEITGSSILHKFNNHLIYLSTQGFVQTNTTVASSLYHTARLWLQDFKLNTICDVFCGHGPFLFHLEHLALNCVGIEVNEKAIHFARATNQERTNKSQFLAMDSGHIELKLREISPDLVVVNPPRAGLGEFCNILIKQRPTLILYSSCNLTTLKRDLLLLKETYQIEKVQLFDMFPHTQHFETLVLLKAL